MKNTAKIIILICISAIFACGDGGGGPDILGPCEDCAPGSGALQFDLPLLATDVRLVRATVYEPDGITVHIARDFPVVAGDVQGEIANILANVGYQVQIDGYPLQTGPDAAVVIYSGRDNAVTVVAGATTFLTIQLMPQVGTVNVTAVFPVGDNQNPFVSYVSVVPTGLRYTTTVTYYISTLAPTQVTGATPGVLVGTSRTFTCKSYNAAGVLLHEGAVAGQAVTQAGPNNVTCNMAIYAPNRGTIDLDPTTVCIPNCGTRVCGLEPTCSTSCGRCYPAETCNGAGQCI